MNWDELIKNNIMLSEKKIDILEDIEKICDYLKLNYANKTSNDMLGMGGTCVIAFKDGDNVVKVCIKNKVLNTIESFKNHVEMLSISSIKIVKPTEYPYENESFLVYKQPYCVTRKSTGSVMR